MICFIGSVGEKGGPAIKNKLLVEYLQKHTDVKLINTYNQSVWNRIKSILLLTFTPSKQIIIGVSHKGRKIMYPILRIKKRLSKSLNFSCIIMAGSFINKLKQGDKGLKKTLSLASLVTVETQTLKKEMNALGFENAYYLPNYKVLTGLTNDQKHDYSTEALRFVYMSSLRNVKGLRTMIEAFSNLLEKHPAAILDIYGPIKNDFDLSVLDGIKENKSINYRGVIENKDVVEKLSQYDVFVFPSECKTEGFPAVLVDAQAAGLPVIASDIQFNCEIIADRKNGFIFKAGDVEALTDCFLLCFNNAEKMMEMAECNRENVKTYDRDTVVQKYIEALKKHGWKI